MIKWTINYPPCIIGFAFLSALLFVQFLPFLTPTVVNLSIFMSSFIIGVLAQVLSILSFGFRFAIGLFLVLNIVLQVLCVKHVLSFNYQLSLAVITAPSFVSMLINSREFSIARMELKTSAYFVSVIFLIFVFRLSGYAANSSQTPFLVISILTAVVQIFLHDNFSQNVIHRSIYQVSGPPNAVGVQNGVHEPNPPDNDNDPLRDFRMIPLKSKYLFLRPSVIMEHFKQKSKHTQSSLIFALAECTQATAILLQILNLANYQASLVLISMVAFAVFSMLSLVKFRTALTLRRATCVLIITQFIGYILQFAIPSSSAAVSIGFSVSSVSFCLFVGFSNLMNFRLYRQEHFLMLVLKFTAKQIVVLALILVVGVAVVATPWSTVPETFLAAAVLMIAAVVINQMWLRDPGDLRGITASD